MEKTDWMIDIIETLIIVCSDNMSQNCYDDLMTKLEQLKED